MLTAFRKLFTFMSNSVRDRGMHNYIFGVFGIIAYVSPVFIPDMIDGWPLHIGCMRVIASVVCVLLCFIDYVPLWWKMRYGWLLWYFALTFCLPFFSSYMAFITNYEATWTANMLLSIVLLLLLVDNVSFLIMLIIGLMSSYALYTFIDDQNPIYLHAHGMHFVAYSYAFTMLSIFIFVHYNNATQKGKLETMQIFAGAIAHEVRGAISNVYTLAETALDIAESAVRQEMDVASVSREGMYNDDHCVVLFSKRDYDMLLQTIPNNMLQVAKGALRTITELMESVREGFFDTLRSYSMVEIVRNTLSTNDIADKRDKIKLCIVRDFLFVGSMNLLQRIIVNLVRNAFIHGGVAVDVVLTVDYGVLRVKDNGNGIPQNILQKIFQPFYRSGDDSGFGVGLAFCDIVMRLLNGSITCNSVVGEFTEFTLKFPTQRVFKFFTE